MANLQEHSMGLQSLEELCLCKLTNEFDHFPVCLLSRLPRHLRRALLCRLPAADILGLEKSPEFADGVDFNSAWSSLLNYFVDLLFRRTPSWNTYSNFGPFLDPEFLLPSAKENFLAVISKLLFLCRDPRLTYDEPEYFKYGRWNLVGSLLFGLPSAVANNKDGIAVPTSGRCSIQIPSRYVSYLTDSLEDTSEMISQVIKLFKHGPKAIHMCCDETIDNSLFLVDDHILSVFLRRVVDLGIHFVYNFFKEPGLYYNLLEKIIHSQCKSCLLYTSPSPRDATLSRMPSSA